MYAVKRPHYIGGYTMREFREDNTEGYTEAELDILNGQWEGKVRELELELESYEYYNYLRVFADRVARR
jgi:hypothetical protein